jgi:GNAT superfamily N-acetyltransferase
MTTPLLRPAVPTDLPDILRLIRALAEYERNLHHAVVTEADLRALLFGHTPRAHVVLAQTPGQKPIGIALYYFTVSTFAGRTGLFLEDLFVDPAHRGTGIGLALMRHMAAIAVAGNCHVIEWRVLDWNKHAIEFYYRLGARQMQGWHTRQLRGDSLAALAQGAPRDRPNV